MGRRIGGLRVERRKLQPYAEVLCDFILPSALLSFGDF